MRPVPRSFAVSLDDLAAAREAYLKAEPRDMFYKVVLEPQLLPASAHPLRRIPLCCHRTLGLDVGPTQWLPLS